MYYRRHTRMFPYYGLKYFLAKGVLTEAYYKHTTKLALDNPPKDYYQPPPKAKKNNIDDKLINRLFLRYPDLKYEPIAKKKYPGQPLTTFTYAYAFITEQKKLIKQGYTLEKSFEIVEKMYHNKIQRKLDQTLLSRGLAIGNRARSILTVYQQQSEYESRLKTLRTSRELEKYLLRQQNVIDRAESDFDQYLQENFSTTTPPPHKSRTEEVQEKDEQYKKPLYENEPLDYERIFHKVTDKDLSKDGSAILQQHTYRKYKNTLEEGPNRNKQVDAFQGKLKTLFSQFYERAASKDRLQGLTDQQIIDQIRSSPTRVKKHSLQILNFVRSHNIQLTLEKGDVKLKGKDIPLWIKTFCSKPEVKIALLSEELQWEKPTKKAYLISKEAESIVFAQQKRLKGLKQADKTQDQLDQIKLNKKRDFQVVVEEQIPYGKGSYKLYESQEERLLRLQVKYYDMLCHDIIQNKKNQEEKQKEQAIISSKQIKKEENNGSAQQEETPTEIDTLEELTALRQKTIEKFRRLKYRLEQKHKAMAQQDLLFSEHEAIKQRLNFEESVEYEELINYLRKKTEDRRLTSFAQANDARINRYLVQITVNQAPQREGDLKVQY